ncbi:hypothetical protein ONE63_009261 [Megalurothrips usitatus]|uniref:Eye-specific diacylglycerol kinase n=1 Tax=Megalurothrips usitatus TaxID=439358 RepID=A0AAV7XMP5_9NEOP|nr:hypothetical protein ONE63_009261 [Megalurothrips usitatus]
MQSSLDVPKTVRSASFDEIQLEAKRLEGGPAPAGGGDAAGEASTSGSLLRVPLVGGQRSKSFDGAGGHYVSPPPSASTTGAEEGGAFLEVPARSRFQRRRSSGERTVACIHCALLEEWRRDPLPAPPPLPCSPVGDSDDSDSDSDVGDDEDDDDDDVASLPPESPPPWPGPEDVVVPACGIRVTLSTSPASPEQERPPTPPPVAPVRRRSIQRQEALFVEPSSSSIEYASDATSEGSDAVLGPPQPPTTLAPGVEGGAGGPGGLLVRDFYLAVPELKRDRAASVDSCFINKTPAGGKAEEVVQTSNLEPCLGPRSTLEPPPPPGTLRSRSVDIVLPTDEQARYKALAMAAPAPPAAPVPLTR